MMDLRDVWSIGAAEKPVYSLLQSARLVNATARHLDVSRRRGASEICAILSVGDTNPEAMGSSRVAVSADGSCVVAALETDGVYCLQKSKLETQAVTVSSSPTSQISGSLSSTLVTLSDHEMEQLQSFVTIFIAGALGFVTLMIIMKHRARDRSPRQAG